MLQPSGKLGLFFIIFFSYLSNLRLSSLFSFIITVFNLINELFWISTVLSLIGFKVC